MICFSISWARHDGSMIDIYVTALLFFPLIPASTHFQTFGFRLSGIWLGLGTSKMKISRKPKKPDPSSKVNFRSLSFPLHSNPNPSFGRRKKTEIKDNNLKFEEFAGSLFYALLQKLKGFLPQMRSVGLDDRIRVMRNPCLKILFLSFSPFFFSGEMEYKLILIS